MKLILAAAALVVAVLAAPFQAEAAAPQGLALGKAIDAGPQKGVTLAQNRGRGGSRSFRPRASSRGAARGRGVASRGRVSRSRRVTTRSAGGRRVVRQSRTTRSVSRRGTSRRTVRRTTTARRGGSRVVRGSSRRYAYNRGPRASRPGTARRIHRGRPPHRVDRRGRYYRKGRWYAGAPRWRGNRRYYRGYYWRPAYNGWYYWADSAWIWAPTFGIVAATIPYWAGTTTVVVSSYEPWSDEWYDWCDARYRSFDPSTGTFMGYDGIRRFCVYRG